MISDLVLGLLRAFNWLIRFQPMLPGYEHSTEGF